MEASPDHQKLYLENAEIYAAVHVIANVAEHYHVRCQEGDSMEARAELFKSLIAFFGNFDRNRTDELASLTALVVDLTERVSPLMQTLDVWFANIVSARNRLTRSREGWKQSETCQSFFCSCFDSSVCSSADSRRLSSRTQHCECN